MKKKMIMVAMFVGALSLGSCVDNKESASVEAVRGAKTEQLKSVAALNIANADAVKAMSAANVAVREAEAAYAKAKAAAAQAEAGQQEILLQKAQAALAGELEVIKVKAEAELAKAKANLEEAKAELIAAMGKADAATKLRIETLLGKANGLLTTINNDRSSLVSEKNTLAKLKAGLITVKQERENTIAEAEGKKSVAKILIAEYEKYSKEDKANAVKIANEAEAKAIAFRKVYEDVNSDYYKVNEAFVVARNKINNTRFVSFLGNYLIYKYNEQKSVGFKHDDGTYGFVFKDGYASFAANVEKINVDIAAQSKDLSIAEAALKDANKALTDAEATEAYKGYVKAVADAEKKFAAAKTESEKYDALRKLNAAKADLDNYIGSYKLNVKSGTERVERATAELAILNEFLIVATGEDATEYQKLLNAFIKALDNKVTAEILSEKAYHNYDIQNSLAMSLRNVANGLADYAGLILAQQIIISQQDEMIADAEAVVTKEQAIVNSEKKIANLENNLSVNEPIYKDYLAQIKALIENAE